VRPIVCSVTAVVVVPAVAAAVTAWRATVAARAEVHALASLPPEREKQRPSNDYSFPFAFSPASRSNRSALRRLWISWNSGSAWLSAIVCLEIRFRVRETPEWKLHAAELETEMLGRRMTFEVID
jgi:hypothetical protein